MYLYLGSYKHYHIRCVSLHIPLVAQYDRDSHPLTDFYQMSSFGDVLFMERCRTNICVLIHF